MKLGAANCTDKYLTEMRKTKPNILEKLIKNPKHLFIWCTIKRFCVFKIEKKNYNQTKLEKAIYAVWSFCFLGYGDHKNTSLCEPVFVN